MELTEQSTTLATRPQAFPRPRAQARPEPMERSTDGLGWFSLGLGLAQLIAPRQVARLIGVDEDDENVKLAMLAVGVRELTCGLGLLSHSKPAVWAWARVAGDIVDLALLGTAMQSPKADHERLLAATASVVGVTGVDAWAAVTLARRHHEPLAAGVIVEQAITINRAPEEVYGYFRNLENLPSFMAHLESVRVINGRSHWRARGPLGAPVEWDAETIEDRPGELIAWRSLPGADVPNQGRVEFRTAPGGRGTEVVVKLSYDPPLGAIGSNVARLFGAEPAQEVASDLRRLKQVLETGEVLRSDASIHRGMHPARPARFTSQERKQLRS